MLGQRTSERVVGGAGILFVVGVVVGFGLLVGRVPGPEAEADEIRDFLARSEIRVWVGGYVGLLGQLAFLVFAAGLWGMLSSGEGGSGWLSTAGLAAAVTAAAATVAGDLVPGAAVFLAGDEVDEATAALLLDAKHLAEMLAVPFIGLFLASAAVVSLRAAVLPRWAGRSAAFIAVLALLLLPLGYEPSQIPLFLTAVWILAVSVRLLARPAAVQG